MVPATYFDGRTTRATAVQLAVIDRALLVSGADVELRVPVAHIVVDERLGSAPRRLNFPGGACCEVRDLAALDRLLLLINHRDGWVDRMQRRRGSTLFVVLAFVVVVAVIYRWGLPWAAAVGARRLPPVVAATISTQTLKTLDAGLLRETRVPEARQRSITIQFDDLQSSERDGPHSSLLFRASPHLGANAFTLPDGSIVLLDDLTTALGDDPHLLAVLAHELGHAHERHGVQLLLRSTAIGALLTFYLGDLSQLMAAAPAALVQARYSQEFERQADDYAAALLVQHGLSPELLADDLIRLSRLRAEGPNSGYLASHPPTEERILRIRQFAGARK